MIRKLVPDEFPRSAELFAIAFEQPLKRGGNQPDDGPSQRWAAFDDGSQQMMSMLTVSDFYINFDGNASKMGGIGGVSSLPQFRRKRGIRGCFEAMLPSLYHDGYDFSYLYPFSTAYYRKFGYECCVQKYQVCVDLALLQPVETGGTLRLAEPGTRLTDAVQVIDAAWEERFNMMVRHTPDNYKWLEDQDPAAKQEFTYVYFKKDGTPNAYTVFSKEDQNDGRNLVCKRLFFTDKEGFSGLMALFKSLSTDHRFVKFTLPALTGMQYLFPEWSLGAVSWSVSAAGMVRAVNALNVLKKARYIGDGEIVLEIKDPQIPENNQTFEVFFSGGKACSVMPVQRKPAVTLEIPAFSALIAGVCDFEDARKWMPGISLCRDASALPRIFYRKPLFIVDHF